MALTDDFGAVKALLGSLEGIQKREYPLSRNQTAPIVSASKSQVRSGNLHNEVDLELIMKCLPEICS